MSKPFQSKLIPHFGVITELRRKRRTWREIAEELGKMGVKSSPSAICEFTKRHRKRPAPLGFVDEAAESIPMEEIGRYMEEVAEALAKIAKDMMDVAKELRRAKP